MHFTVTITGTTPLICNSFTDAAAMAASSGNRASTVGDKGTPHDIAEGKLYRSGTDLERFIIPQPNVMRCIIDGGTYFKAGKSKVTTQKSSLLAACLDVYGLENGAEIPIESKHGWTVDTRAVRIPSTGGRILCHRPLFNDWRLTFGLELDETVISAGLLREIIDTAGKRIGLGDFRPACKGPFGKFVVEHWQLEREREAA